MTDEQLEAFTDYKAAIYKLECARKELHDAKWAFEYAMGDDLSDLERDMRMGLH